MSDILHETESLCPVCLKKIPARYERIDGRAYMIKECPEHGEFKVLFWRDADMYESWMRQGVHAPARDHGRPEKRGCPFDCGLCDEHRSGTCTSILEITYRCNMNCNICFADANAEKFEPDMAQIRKMYAAALGSNRYCSVQLSGGEPTVRDDLPEIVRLGKEMGVAHLQVNTNGIRIAREPEFLERLRDAGLDLIYLQFDGLDDGIYRTIRGREMLDIKLKAIENCEKAGVGILLVPVVIPGVNLHRLGEIVRFAKVTDDKGHTLPARELFRPFPRQDSAGRAAAASPTSSTPCASSARTSSKWSTSSRASSLTRTATFRAPISSPRTAASWPPAASTRTPRTRSRRILWKRRTNTRSSAGASSPGTRRPHRCCALRSGR
ncbi:MAG: radical SAM protein [Oscillospiraceae bacterium]